MAVRRVLRMVFRPWKTLREEIEKSNEEYGSVAERQPAVIRIYTVPPPISLEPAREFKFIAPKIEASKEEAKRVKETMAHAQANIDATVNRIGDVLASYTRRATQIIEREDARVAEYADIKRKVSEGEATPEQMFQMMMRDGLIDPKTGQLNLQSVANKVKEQLRDDAQKPTAELLKAAQKEIRQVESAVLDTEIDKLKPLRPK